MKTKIRYARVVVPDEEHSVVDRGGHKDSFLSPDMETDEVIQVKHRSERGWYREVVEGNRIGWNYHCSWLKFVRKPKGNE